MRICFAIIVVMLPAVALAQDRDPAGVGALIAKLGSANFKERLAAAKALGERPEAAPALREALRSGSVDAEVQRRIGEILEYYQRRPLREVAAAAKDGDFGRFIEILTTLPNGKYELESWIAFRDFAQQLAKLHETNGGKRLGLFDHPIRFKDPWLLSAERVTERTKSKKEDEQHFLRVVEYDVDYGRVKPVPKAGERTLNYFDWIPLVAAHRTVRAGVQEGCVIMAGGSVHVSISPSASEPIVIISGGDVTVSRESLCNALVIARGKVSIIDGRMHGCVTSSRIISGKSITCNKEKSTDSIISENDNNPLGFIRWADAPKDKPAPKKK